MRAIHHRFWHVGKSNAAVFHRGLRTAALKTPALQTLREVGRQIRGGKPAAYATCVNRGMRPPVAQRGMIKAIRDHGAKVWFLMARAEGLGLKSGIALSRVVARLKSHANTDLHFSVSER